MSKVLICYTFTQLPPNLRNKLRRSLYGSEESPHGGKYSTTMIGFLSDKKYEKPVRSTILLDKKDVKGVLAVLSKFKAKVKMFAVSKEVKKKDI